MVRCSRPHSFSAAASVFCREAADHFPTISDAVACPNFSDPAIRSRSSQQETIRSSSSRAVSSEPACGKRAAMFRGAPVRHSVIFPRSRMRGDSSRPTRSNRAKFTRVTPWVSVACSVTGKSVALPRISSSTKWASRQMGTMTRVP